MTQKQIHQPTNQPINQSTNQPTMTSLKQVNENHQAWQDRHDVDKAFKEWVGTNAIELWRPAAFDQKEMKAFATFFAERVKGAPINTASKNCACQSCKTTQLITENHCNVCGAKQG